MKGTFTRLSTKELATLAQRVISSSKGGKYPVVENHELLKAIEKEYADYDAVYSKLSFSGKGKDVAEADALRDKAFANLKTFVSGYSSLSYMPHAAEAAEIYQIFKTFGLNIDRMNYADETAQLKKLIEELEKSDNKKKLTALNLTQAFDELKSTQEQFEVIYGKQSEANAGLRLLPSASTIRKSLEDALRNYFNLLTAMKAVSGWEMVYADISELVKSLNAYTQTQPKITPKTDKLDH